MAAAAVHVHPARRLQSARCADSHHPAEHIGTCGITCSARPFPTRILSHLITLQDREMAAEKAWVNAEEERLLRNLLKKAKAAQSAEEKAKEEARQMAELNKVVGAKLTDAEKKALLAWKETH